MKRTISLSVVAALALMALVAVTSAAPSPAPLDSSGLSGLGSPMLTDANGTATTSVYDGHQVVRVFADASEGALAGFIATNHIDMWSDTAPMRDHVDLRLSPAEQVLLRAAVPGAQTEVLVADVGELLRASLATAPRGGPRKQQTDDGSLRAQFKLDSSYLPLPQIASFVDALAAKSPHLVAKSAAGQSYEKRDILAVKVGAKRQGGIKQGIVVMGGVHAREWVGPAVVLNAMHDLVAGYGVVPRITALLDFFDIYFLPVVNPDGYAYSMDKDRLWRKSRQPTANPSCVGIDVNRNFPYKWETMPAAGTGGKPASECDITYPGARAGDAAEVAAVTAWLKKLQETERASLKLAGLFDLHAYSQLWMYPYGWSCSTKAPDAPALQATADRAAAAIKGVSGASFKVGQICNTIYQAAGSSADWAYAELGITFAYALELSPGPDTPSGFLLPPTGIAAAFNETQAGFLASLESIKEHLGGGPTLPGSPKALANGESAATVVPAKTSDGATHLAASVPLLLAASFALLV
ncbi:hypothetical protein H9P43_008425 [Blastocladiella emersonii ATCC 22665]|nr:hypothetical protein H9P43_008425 [Blastocladiella emersonii ATCC 22665]